MAKKKIRPSEATSGRARETYLYGLLEDERYFSIDRVRRNKIVFRFAGYEIVFVRNEGRVYRQGGDQQFLSTEDYLQLFVLAKMYFAARDMGDKEAKTEKVKKKKAVPVAESGILFDFLPVQRNPKKRRWV